MRNAVNDWEHALVTGNGRQGALCWGAPEALKVTVSHERLFFPLGPPLDPPDTARILPELREMLEAGRYAEAARAVCVTAAAEEPRYAETVWIDPLVGAATVTLHPHLNGPVRDFRRTVDMYTGLVTHRWRDDGGDARVDVFASRPADAIVVRFRGSAEMALIDGTPPGPIRSTVDGLDLEVSFEAATWPGALTGYRVRGRWIGEDTLVIRTLLPGDPDPGVTGDFDDLLAEHTAVHGELMSRVRLNIKGGELERLFDAGRYLVVSSTGDLPPTLQGVWSGTWTPAWSSGYTLDGNLQAVVAAVLATRTPELLLPVFDLLDRVSDDLRRNARRLFGARGLLTPAHMSTHGLHNHFGPVWCLTFWTAGAGWLSRLYVDYWRYTGDREFLSVRAWPFLREIADFVLDFVEIRDGAARFTPSYSPENAPADTGSQAAINATMDVAVTRDLLTNLIRIHAELGLDDPDLPRWQALLVALPAYRIAGGMLAEWCHPDLADQPAHRHASHLWPLWYEPDPLITEDPALRAAAVATVRSRLAWWSSDESGEMAFGLFQLGLAAAALGLAEEARTAVELMADRYWRPNLVPTHNRGELFNVDIAGGLPAVVAAMLVRCAHGRLDLLPALPAAWPRGRVTGLAARDAVEIRDLSWEPGRVRAVLRSAHDTHLTIGGPPGTAPWSGWLKGGQTLTLSWVSIKTNTS